MPKIASHFGRRVDSPQQCVFVHYRLAPFMRVMEHPDDGSLLLGLRRCLSAIGDVQVIVRMGENRIFHSRLSRLALAFPRSPDWLRNRFNYRRRLRPGLLGGKNASSIGDGLGLIGAVGRRGKNAFSCSRWGITTSIDRRDGLGNNFVKLIAALLDQAAVRI